MFHRLHFSVPVLHFELKSRTQKLMSNSLLLTIMLLIEHQNLKLRSSRKYPYPAQGRSLEILRGRGVSKAKYDAKLKIPGGRVKTKKHSVGEGTGIFSGSKHIIVK